MESIRRGIVAPPLVTCPCGAIIEYRAPTVGGRERNTYDDLVCDDCIEFTAAGGVGGVEWDDPDEGAA